MRYKLEDIETLISQLKIEEVVGEFVALKKSGSSYRGLCPFHADNNPSFMVSPKKNICKCFVCGAGGNPVTFYAKYKNISYSEAIGELAKKYHINIKGIPTDVKREEKYEKYYKIMEDAHDFFKENIFSNNGRQALEYLANRQVTPKIITDNGIGFASDKWEELHDHLISKGYSKDDIIALGLIKEGEKGIYDTFRDRVVFPIYSASGRVIAFGGRIITKNKDIAKYINSPDTPIFKKGKNLYGLERGSILKKKKYAILMEGYMDVLSSYIYGFDTAVAPLGTALTEEQAILLKKYVSDVYLSFDSDGPGRMAAEKAIYTLIKVGFINIRVIKYEGAKDPDEFLKTYGKEAYLDAVQKSLLAFDFLYEYYAKDYDMSNIMGKLNFIRCFKEFFQWYDSSALKSTFLDKLSKSLDIDRDALKEELITNNKPTEEHRSYYDTEVKSKEISNIDDDLIADELEKETMIVILSDLDNYKYFQDKHIKGSLTKKVFNHLAENGKQTDDVDTINIMRDLSKSAELTEKEQQVMDDIVCRTIGSGTHDELQPKLSEVFLSWFRQELKESKKERSSIDTALSIARMEQKIKELRNFPEILDMYKKYEKEIVFQN